MRINENISHKIKEYERLLIKTTNIENIFILVVDKNRLKIITQNRDIVIDRDDYVASIILETYHTQISRSIPNIKKSFLYRNSIDNLIDENIKSLLVTPVVDNEKTLALIWIAIKDIEDIELPSNNLINSINISLKEFLLTSHIEDNYKENSSLSIKDSLNLNILVVDDNIIITKFIEASLKELDVNIIRVSTGLDAIEKFKTIKNIILIFMDEIMPNGIYGHEAVQQIRDIEKRESFEPIIILALTSDETKKTFDNRVASGVNKVLYKPIKPKRLLTIVKDFIFKEKGINL